MRKIKHAHHFNQKIKKKILKYRYLSWSARLVKIGSFSLYVALASIASLTKTCVAADPVDAVRSQCGCSSKLGASGCSSKLAVMSPVVETDAFIRSQHETIAPTRGYTAPDEREIPRERALALHPAVGVDVELGRTMPTIHVEPGQKLIFKIEGMCCPTEVGALKDALRSLNKDGREVDLAFDLINAKLSVERKSGSIPTEEEVVKAVAKTGMKAKLWNDHVKQEKEKKTFWQRYGHLTLTMISAACVVVGVIIHAILKNVNDAFGGGVGGNEAERPENPPIATMAFYSAAIVSGGFFILPKAVRAVKRLRPDSNVLMIAATGGAVGINHWFEAASSMFLFSAAGLLEEWNMARARKSVRALMELAPSTAQVVNEDGTIAEQLLESIPIGTTITVRPGEKIPMDSVLIAGATCINQAPITGESMPIQKEVGDPLFAGTINEDSVIQCKVTKAASDSTLAAIIRKVEESQSSRAKTDQFIEKFSRYYVPAMIATSLTVCIIPPLATKSSWYPWVYKGLELLVISCPCSLIISTPVSIAAGLAAAARAGILIKGGAHLEAAAHIRAFAMDKTGTLTTGAPIVQNVIPLNGYDTERLLMAAVALETHSDHPLARAIQRKAREDGIATQPAESFQVVKGKGGEGYIDGELFWVGSHRFLHEKVGDNETAAVHEKIQELEAAGHSIVAIGTGQTTCGLISIADAVRPESKYAIQAIKRAKVKRVVMLTGDNEGAAKTIATSIGIDEYRAELLPEDKVHQVEGLVRSYKRVAMVGDGINDTPAMAASSLGIAMGAAGSDAAIETADIALMSDDLEKLAWLIKHSRHTLNVIKQNIAFSLLVKGAFAGLTFANKSTLWMALLSDMGTSFIVVSNGLRLLANKAKGQRQPISGAEKTSSIVSFRQAEFRWTDPTGIQKTFREGQVLGDGDCGFTSLGIPSSATRTARETAIALLREHAHEEAIRILVRPDLLERLINPTADTRTLPPSLEALRVRFRNQHDVLLGAIAARRAQVNRDLGREGDAGLGLDQVADHIRDAGEAGQYRQQLLELNAIKAEMEAFTPTQDQTDTFLQDEFINRREYLSYQRGGGGTLEALVRVMGVGVTVFTGDRTLSPTLHVPGPPGGQHFYLHHTGGTDSKGRTFLNHFNVLYEPSSSPDSSVAAAAVDGDGSAKGEAAPSRGDGAAAVPLS